ncbi:KinB-signaling pathway activation protein [Paenibacillus eucommiae]|uniref:KinB signaling pathway activation protein n=1 Tax=Paenibacillus eucommiae TaxID=1355755 RepID=A0ABS4J9B3_9BACL|nr:KinB-signaling pathway activation protein [Paenibacillus eucommiae]MBP1996390.1 KinB signaling pathway activation protein [Paenibacillus eucommiae]
MTLRKWFHLFWSTLLIGIIASTITGLILQFSDSEFPVPGISGVGFNVINMILGGATISVLSQMGFFSFLIVRFIAIGIIRKKFIWDIIQLALVIVALVDLVYLRFSNFEGSLWAYSITPILILLASVAVSYWKVKLTNPTAFIPALFFMVVVTILEAVPAFKQDSAASTVFMLVPLMICNAYQILNLHKMSDKKRS